MLPLKATHWKSVALTNANWKSCYLSNHLAGEGENFMAKFFFDASFFAIIWLPNIWNLYTIDPGESVLMSFSERSQIPDIQNKSHKIL